MADEDILFSVGLWCTWIFLYRLDGFINIKSECEKFIVIFLRIIWVIHYNVLSIRVRFVYVRVWVYRKLRKY